MGIQSFSKLILEVDNQNYIDKVRRRNINYLN